MKIIGRMALAIIAFTTFAACGEKENQEEVDQGIIQQYLAGNNLTAEEHPSGLHYIINEPGTGDEFPDLTDSVTVRYTGYTTDGVIFDQTQGDNTVKFRLANLIPGWQIGIQLIKKGGEISLYTPSSLAYGTGNHPLARQVLIFEIELIDH